jgi:hypothetical protein
MKQFLGQNESHADQRPPRTWFEQAGYPDRVPFPLNRVPVLFFILVRNVIPVTAGPKVENALAGR